VYGERRRRPATGSSTWPQGIMGPESVRRETQRLHGSGEPDCSRHSRFRVRSCVAAVCVRWAAKHSNRSRAYQAHNACRISDGDCDTAQAGRFTCLVGGERRQSMQGSDDMGIVEGGRLALRCLFRSSNTARLVGHGDQSIGSVGEEEMD
jgi:hypothetical protein